MCILGLSINCNENYPFICIHNRDEDLKRPSSSPFNSLNSIWADGKYHSIIGGKDKIRNVPWFAFNKVNGQFSAINNFRSNLYPPLNKDRAGSRGELVLEILTNPNKYKFNNDKVDLESEYPGFGLIYGNLFSDRVSINHMTNRPKIFDINVNNKGYVKELENGTHCYSNGYLNDETWPKVKFCKTGIENIITNSCYDHNNEKYHVSNLVNNLATLFMDTRSFENLKDLSWSPLTKEKELANQKIFIEHDKSNAIKPLEFSGTCSQSIIIKTKTGNIYFYYRDLYSYPMINDWEIFQL